VSSIGKIINLPLPGSSFARVRDEYGNEYSVEKEELPKDSKAGDTFAYIVDVNYHEKSLATTLKHERPYKNPSMPDIKENEDPQKK